MADFYSEEKTLSAHKPKQQNIPTKGGKNPQLGSARALPIRIGEKAKCRNLKDVEDKDIDTLLSSLSFDELTELNNDFDPDNSFLPPSQRCRDQTDKKPTGPYEREKLLNFLEEKAKNEKDWEEAVPYCPGVKRGKVFEPKIDENKPSSAIGTNSDEMQMPIELDIDSDDGDDAVENALGSAAERDLVDLAGILGMHNVLNQPQYYNALKGKNQSDETGTTFTGVIKAFQPRVVPDEPENQTDIEECIKRLSADDAALDEININNMKRLSKERIRELIRAATKSTHIKKLFMANTAISDSESRQLVELLETSKSLKVLNIESNFISPEQIAKLMRSTLKTQSLVEFHAENQRASILGNQIEMDIMLSVEDNDSLLRVGVPLQSMEARSRISEALERNYERLRLKRLEQRGVPEKSSVK